MAEKITHFLAPFTDKTACGRMATETCWLVKYVTSERKRVSCLSCLRSLRSASITKGNENG